MIALTPALLDALDAAFGNVWLSNDGEQVNVTCPMCHHRGKTRDQSGHLGINFNVDGGVFHCIRCDWGGRNLRELFQRHHIDTAGLSFARLEDAKRRQDREVEWIGDVQISLPPVRRLVEGDFSGETVFGQSLASKNIRFEQAHAHGLCACEEGPASGYVIFPFFERGGDEPVYWQGRDATGQRSLRKLNPGKKDTPYGKAYWLYNLDRAVRGGTFYIVEGTLDAISLQDWADRTRGEGHCAISTQGTAMSFPGPGTHPLNTQYGKLKSFKPAEVLVVYDADAWEKSQGLAAALQRCGLPARPVRLTGGDPNELGDRVGPMILHPEQTLRRRLGAATF